jgi:hypothetical protein
LMSPVDTAIVQFNSITFNWEAMPGADMYIFEVSISPSFPFSIITRSFYNGTTSTSVISGLPNNRLLYWRVRAYSNWDVCQPNDVVQVGVCKTVNLSATNDFEKVAFVELSPNPVMGGSLAQLEIESSEAFEAFLQITDAAGRRVHHRVVRIDYGTSTIALETNDLPAGVYQITLQSNKGVVVKRLAVTE